MVVPIWVWALTVVGVLALLALDLFIVDRTPHRVTIREASKWVVFYVCCAVVFGVGIWLVAGGNYAGQFLSGYLTEYSLSVDNLFVFVVVMSAFSVPVIHQHRVLLIGVLLALILRALLIFAGAALISSFSAIFYLFGAFLIYTAYKMVRAKQEESEEYRDNAVIRMARKFLPVTAGYDGAKSFVKRAGKWMVTPMLIVMIAIGTTDLLFALDSIPAIFGLTKQSFLVFTANAFALMGLRQLYFLLGGLLTKLVYLPIGLAVILLFIGVKLIFEVLHDDALPFVPGRQAVHVPVINTPTSLVVIVGVLIITATASLLKSRRDTAGAG